MLLVGFRGLTVKDAATTVADIKDRGLGGVLLFDYDSPTGTYHRNVSSPDQLRKLVAGLRAAATIPLLVAIDEEGGQVDRLKARYGFPATVSEAALGAKDDAAGNAAAGEEDRGDPPRARDRPRSRAGRRPRRQSRPIR